jgi:Alpha/beta hydrolase
MSTRPPTVPPARGSPADNATWWRSLSTLQHQQVIREHPDWVGNRDGVSFSDRDLANRALLTIDRDRLVTERERLDAALAGDRFFGVFTNEDAALRQVKDKLASIDVIEASLASPGERQLLLLDLGHERAEAAIANGNVETADNVAVFVPGMSSNVTDTMKDYDTEMRHMQQRAQLESIRAHPAQASTTATVTWVGYQTPEVGLDLVTPSRSVAFDDTAKRGAASLVPFLQGIGAARDHDAHLTLLGHSYGSTTAGIALQQETGVDDAVFFGSPGLGTKHLQDLKLAPGHASYIEARWDPVGDVGVFGRDPSHVSGIEHASARESTVVDPVTGESRHFDEVTGHVSYLVDDSTSQYNMSVVIAGVSDRQVDDSGEGFGDVLTWPLPWTS